MQKQLIIVIALLAVLGLGLFAFMQSKKSISSSVGTGSTSTTVTQESAQPTGTPMSTGSIKDLLTAGKNVTCAVDYGQGGTKGTVYVSGDKVRADFAIQVSENATTQSHMVKTGDYTYIWTEGNAKGTKIKVDVNAMTTPGATGQNKDMDLSQQFGMDCSTWLVDGSKFVPPSDVDFVDLSAMMNQTGGRVVPTSAPQSSPCDAITDPTSKAACVKAVSGGGY